MGTNIVSLGEIHNNAENLELLEDLNTENCNYKKLYFKGGIITGGILIGDTSKGGILIKGIRTGMLKKDILQKLYK